MSRRAGVLTWLWLLCTGCTAPPGAPPNAPLTAIRVNQIGYRPEAMKVAVACSRDSVALREFRVLDESGRVVLGPLSARPTEPLASCAVTHRLDFTALREPGTYTITTGGETSAPIRIDVDVYDGVADTLLGYLRQQRSLFNPLLRDSVHERTDGILVDHATRSGEFVYVSGGWADAADYLQYVTTSATSTYMLLAAYRDHADVFGDGFAADGLPGANGVADVLDEARWGLEWLLRMFPEDDLLLNQLGDDRDHEFLDLPTTDSSDYGWGRGGYRPVYPCTGKPQGLFENINRSDGVASTAGKIASAFALASRTFAARDSSFAYLLARKAVTAYALGRARPGVCQTAPARSSYFYEEENWVDDMELAAAELHALTGDDRYLREALGFAAQEPVSPWMGQDTARHYQWFPWHNHGHHVISRSAAAPDRSLMAEYYRRGLNAVNGRATNGFRVGIPFIWCSNDLMVALATQAILFRRMTGETRFAPLEAAAVDWLFGANPWGVSMVIGVPADGEFPRDPHSVVAQQLGWKTQKGGLVDGPVYRSIFENLQYVRLQAEDEYAPWNTGSLVYHDDWGDYSTNEPILDGTASLVYLAAMLDGSWTAGSRF